MELKSYKGTSIAHGKTPEQVSAPGTKDCARAKARGLSMASTLERIPARLRQYVVRQHFDGYDEGNGSVPPSG
jgi:hypothetical protein